MRIASFKVDEKASYGVVDGETLRQPGDDFRSRHEDLRAVIAAGRLAELSSDTGGESLNISDVQFLPVIPNPDKVLCVGVNYRPHIEEMGRPIPDYPVVFVRFPGSQTGHGQALVKPRVSKKYDYEGELAVVIGKRARHVGRSEALDCIAGYSCFMDGSVRDWQSHTPQFTAGKNFAQSGSMGPWLVTRDEVPDPADLTINTRLNGALMQDGRLADLLFDIPALIEYCSTFTELLPGDIIATGTPGGVGAARTPPVWLEQGDSVEVEIPGIGLLVNSVVDE